jgi:CheY-like chemotaxis protein
LELLRNNLPDLLLLDLHLPGLSGEELLARVRSDPDQGLRELHVAVLTADLSAGVEKRLLASGASDFLGKPVDVRHFLDMLDRQVPASSSRSEGSLRIPKKGFSGD